MTVPFVVLLTAYSSPLPSTRKTLGIGAPGGIWKKVLLPSSETPVGANVAPFTLRVTA